MHCDILKLASMITIIEGLKVYPKDILANFSGGLRGIFRTHCPNLLFVPCRPDRSLTGVSYRFGTLNCANRWTHSNFSTFHAI
jgi:hypothetical protein